MFRTATIFLIFLFHALLIKSAVNATNTHNSFVILQENMQKGVLFCRPWTDGIRQVRVNWRRKGLNHVGELARKIGKTTWKEKNRKESRFVWEFRVRVWSLNVNLLFVWTMIFVPRNFSGFRISWVKKINGGSKVIQNKPCNGVKTCICIVRNFPDAGDRKNSHSWKSRWSISGRSLTLKLQ